MKTLKSAILSSFFVIGLAITPSLSSAAEKDAMVDGQITEVRKGGEFTIKHGPIPNLDMGAMTMVFRVKEPAMAKGLKKGDKIRFHAEEIDGKLTLTSVTKAK